MAAAGTITKLGPSLLATIAREPSYFCFTITEGNSTFTFRYPSLGEAMSARSVATHAGFETSAITPVHRLES